VIVSMAGQPIAGLDDLMRALAAEAIDRALALEVIRRDRRLKLDITPIDAAQKAA